MFINSFVPAVIDLNQKKGKKKKGKKEENIVEDHTILIQVQVQVSNNMNPILHKGSP